MIDPRLARGGPSPRGPPPSASRRPRRRLLRPASLSSFAPHMRDAPSGSRPPDVRAARFPPSAASRALSAKRRLAPRRPAPVARAERRRARILSCRAAHRGPSPEPTRNDRRRRATRRVRVGGKRDRSGESGRGRATSGVPGARTPLAPSPSPPRTVDEGFNPTTLFGAAGETAISPRGRTVAASSAARGRPGPLAAGSPRRRVDQLAEDARRRRTSASSTEVEVVPRVRLGASPPRRAALVAAAGSASRPPPPSSPLSARFPLRSRSPRSNRARRSALCFLVSVS